MALAWMFQLETLISHNVVSTRVANWSFFGFKVALDFGRFVFCFLFIDFIDHFVVQQRAHRRSHRHGQLCTPSAAPTPNSQDFVISNLNGLVSE